MDFYRALHCGQTALEATGPGGAGRLPGQPDRAVVDPLDRHVDVPRRRLGTFVEVPVDVDRGWWNPAERDVAQGERRVRGAQCQGVLRREPDLVQGCPVPVVVPEYKDPFTGTVQDVEHQAAVAPRVRMAHVAQADDCVVGPYLPAPLAYQVVVDPVDVGERPVERLHDAAVGEVEVAPDPRLLRRAGDDPDQRSL